MDKLSQYHLHGFWRWMLDVTSLPLKFPIRTELYGHKIRTENHVDGFLPQKETLVESIGALWRRRI